MKNLRNARNGGALAGILATAAVLLILFAAIGLAMGWIQWSDSPDKSTIEIDKVQMQSDTKEAVNATQKFIKDSAESVEKASSEAVPKEGEDHVTPVPQDQTSPSETTIDN